MKDKIIQIISDHGYTMGLDERGILWRLEQNYKETHDGKARYITRWVFLCKGIGQPNKGDWFKDDDMPF